MKTTKGEKKVFTRTATQSKQINTETKKNNKTQRTESQEVKLNLYKISEIRQEQYIQIPKELFYNEQYSDLSSDAKILYGLLLDRMELSRVNNWINEAGEIYLIFTREEIQDILKISKKTCIKAFKQLAQKGLILEKRQGLNKPNLIFIGHIEYKSAENSDKNRRCKNYTSRSAKITLPEVQKLHPNKTDLNNTNLNDTENQSSQSSQPNQTPEPEKTRQTGLDVNTLAAYETLIKENIAYADLCNSHPYDKKFIDELVNNILDVVMSEKKKITVAGEQKNIELVKSVLLKLNYYQIEYVIEKYKQVTTKIINKRQYILTMLYNARLESESDVINEVAHDLSILPVNINTSISTTGDRKKDIENLENYLLSGSEH